MPLIALIFAVAALVGSYFYFNQPGAPAPEMAVAPTEVVETTATSLPSLPSVEATSSDAPSSNEATPTEAAPTDAAPPEAIVTRPSTVTTKAPTPAVTTPVTPPAPDPAIAAAINGTYTSNEVTYRTPGTNDNRVIVTLTFANNVVTSASVNYNASEGPYNNYQERFDASYKSQVIGKTIDSISLSRVGGASLTSKAFNQAITQIAAKVQS